MTEPTDPDPFRSPLRNTLSIGGIFLALLAFNALRSLLLPGSFQASPPGAPTVPMASLTFLGCAIGSGVSVALARRIVRPMGWRNLVSGVLCGGWYSGACWFLFRNWPGASDVPVLVGVFVSVALVATLVFSDNVPRSPVR